MLAGSDNYVATLLGDPRPVTSHSHRPGVGMTGSMMRLLRGCALHIVSADPPPT